MFINAEISEMYKSFANIFGFNIILISSESGEAFFKHINSKRIITRDKDVDTKVILKIIYKVRVKNILRN
jgi:hypothetical protein